MDITNCDLQISFENYNQDVFIKAVAITNASRKGQRASCHVTYLETTNEGFLVETTNASFTYYV